MIQQIQSNSISFKSSPALKARIEAQNNQQKAVVVDEQPKKKFSITETYNKAKKSVVGFFKGVNNVTGVASGVARGAVEGVAATVVSASVGKALKSAKETQGLKVLLDIPVALISDAGSAIKGSAGWIGRLFTEEKATYKHFGELLSLPKKFYKEYLKGNKAIATIATGIGLAILIFRAIQGKVKANQNNAELEHKTNLGHV